MSVKRGIAFALTAAIGIVGLAGCAPSVGGSSGETVLRYGQFNGPKSLSSAMALWSETSLPLGALYDSLLTRTPENEIEPGLISEWSYDDTQTELTLTLGEEPEFADGSAVTPEVVVQNLEHFASAGGPNSSLLQAVDSVSSEGDDIILTLSERDPSLLLALTQNAGMIENPASFDRSDYGVVPDGTGPYVLDKSGTVTGTTYKFSPRKDYWNPSDQHFDQISLQIYSDATALTNAALAHQVDAANLSPKNDIAALQKAGYTLAPNQLNWTGLSLFDRGGVQTPALADVRVRQAINYAIDRKALLGALAGGDGETTTQVFPAYSAGYDKALDDQYAYDPDKARELLADAGFADGFPMTLPTSTALPSAAFTLIQQALGDVGIDLTLKDDTTDFLSHVFGGDYSIAYLPLQQGTDWELYNFLLAPDGTFNPFHTEDPQVASWAAAIRDGSEDEAADAAKQLDAYIVEQAWFAPFFRQPLNILVNPETITLTVQQGQATPSLSAILPVAAQ